ncbi:bile acid:sodium symporter family protein [Shewanella intestini]|uniref:Bile acid:sodium symporter family protein n=1 Tax=Shewanella intestini TaxID=2017544 RepID=A0ABS5I4F1_9GAMM|nr:MULTISPECIES: bile acid:sodium symporter family protein [Shewanella]MBR9728907.1 bile acid:sodium symporter family protein [Shewanella intestini]MRG37027.1 bile acid:sodium symporter family protein [Shewanella sp. XMDDZSB0408]
MTASVLTQGLLPLAIALIMFGMGLSLTMTDFTRLFRWPKAMVLGLIGQILLLPLMALLISVALDLPPAMAIGLMILSACPGGTTSNVISQLSRANLALSVTLTGLSTLICLLSTPLIIQWSLNHFSSDNPVAFSLLTTTVGLSALTLLPLALGMWVNRHWVVSAQKIEPIFRRFSAIFMVLMIAGILWQERQMLSQSFSDMFLACVLLNFTSVACAVLLSRLGGLSKQDALTLCIEIGIQNATLAILIAMTFLNRPDLAVAAGVYGVTMYLGAGFIVLWAKWPNKQLSAVSIKPRP